MVGGKGNDQFFAGQGHDVIIGGGGANFFDCGLNGNGVILDFNPANADTQASNCKFVVTVHSNANNNPGSTLPQQQQQTKKCCLLVLLCQQFYATAYEFFRSVLTMLFTRRDGRFSSIFLLF